MYFGCENDKFGGNGSILSLHKFDKAGKKGYLVKGGIMKDEAIKIL